MHDQLSRAETQLIEAWLAATNHALNKNKSSFAVLPIGEFLKPDGWLAKLRAKGYSIQDPQGQRPNGSA